MDWSALYGPAILIPDVLEPDRGNFEDYIGRWLWYELLLPPGTFLRQQTEQYQNTRVQRYVTDAIQLSLSTPASLSIDTHPSFAISGPASPRTSRQQNEKSTTNWVIKSRDQVEDGIKDRSSSRKRLEMKTENLNGGTD